MQKKLLLEISQNSQPNTCARVSFLIKFKKETLAQVLSCEFCEIFKNTFLTEHLWTTASESIAKYYIFGSLEIVVEFAVAEKIVFYISFISYLHNLSFSYEK